jgi:hypothetical protein
MSSTHHAAAIPVVKLVKPGDLVHYVLPHGQNKGEHRPAIIVKVWGTPTPTHTPFVQLQAFTDNTNDFATGAGSNGLLWGTSVPHDQTEKKPGTWHWPEE